MSYLLIGLAIFSLGASHLLVPTNDLERRIIGRLQKSLGNPPYQTGFRELWFLGRTTFALVVLTCLIGFNWRLGLPALAVFGLVAGLESLLKALIKRPRPFLKHTEIKMAQPLQPTDPSFPSGDALRVWFLATILVNIAGGSPLLGIMIFLLAGMVSLGRMILGVHYPTDVLAGAGLGLLGASITIWIWQIFNLL